MAGGAVWQRGREVYLSLRAAQGEPDRHEAGPGPRPPAPRGHSRAGGVALAVAALLGAALAVALLGSGGPTRGSMEDTAVRDGILVKAEEVVEDAVGLTEWEVVQDGAPVVESIEEFWNAQVLGRKPQGAVLLGKRSGAWLALACEPGFARISVGFPAIRMLREREDTMERLTAGAAEEDLCEALKTSTTSTSTTSTTTPSITTTTTTTTPLHLDCAWSGENCSDVRCCNELGQSCYAKHKLWAQCLHSCSPGVHNEDKDPTPWSCDRLGGSIGMEDILKKCSWVGENCMESECCLNLEHQCYKKNSNYADCAPSCPADWDCTKLGGRRPPQASVGRAAAGKTAGLSIFCFSTPSYGKEWDLLKQAKTYGVGMYSCNQYLAFPKNHSFVDVWQTLRIDGRYKKHDWIVRIDPDVVFLADRFRSKLKGLAPPADRSIVINPFDKGIGPLKIFSKRAMELYEENSGICTKHVGTGRGEEVYLKECFPIIGAAEIVDVKIFVGSGDWCFDKWTSAFQEPTNDWSKIGCLPKVSTRRRLISYKAAEKPSEDTDDENADELPDDDEPDEATETPSEDTEDETADESSDDDAEPDEESSEEEPSDEEHTE